MKRILFSMLVWLAVWLPGAQAKNDFEQILGGFLQAVSEPQPTATTAAPGTVKTKKKAPGLGDQLVLSLRGATDSLLDAYKAEGREYAREVGDIITKRIMEDKKINDTLDSMRLFCWAVIIYLTVVTLIVLYMLLRLRVLYARLMEELKSKE